MSSRAIPKTLSKTSKRTVVKNVPPKVVKESVPEQSVPEQSVPQPQQSEPQQSEPQQSEPQQLEPQQLEPQQVVNDQMTKQSRQVDEMKEKFDNLINTRMAQVTVLKNEILELKKMQKDFLLTVKNLSKKTKRKRPLVNEDGTPRKPSGFASPVVVSEMLYNFLAQFGVEKGQPIARTDVTRFVTQYIKDKNLQNPEHRREIVPDKVLKEIFGEPVEHKDPNDPSSPKVWTYLRMQKYLSSHFPKKQ